MSVSSTKIHILTQRPNVCDLEGLIPYLESQVGGCEIRLVHDETYSMGLEDQDTEIIVCKFEGQRHSIFARVTASVSTGHISTIEVCSCLAIPV